MVKELNLDLMVFCTYSALFSFLNLKVQLKVIASDKGTFCKWQGNPDKIPFYYSKIPKYNIYVSLNTVETISD